MDPLFGAAVDLGRARARGVDGGADGEPDRPPPLDEAPPPPEVSGVVGDRHHRPPGALGEERAAPAEGKALPRREPGPLREHHHPQAVVEAAPPFADERPRRLVPRRAVDGDGAEQGESPAEERHPQQRPLEQPGLRGEEGLEGEGLPHRLVAAEHDGRLPGEVPRALHDEAKAAGDPEPPEVEPAPAGDEAVADAVRERRAQGGEEGERDGRGHEPREERARPRRLAEGR